MKTESKSQKAHNIPYIVRFLVIVDLKEIQHTFNESEVRSFWNGDHECMRKVLL